MASSAIMPPPPPPAGGQPQQQQSSQQGGSDLVGERPNFQGSEVQKRLKEAMEQVKNLTMGTEDLSKAFPEFAPHARKISDEFKEGLVKIVASMQQSAEVSAPKLGY